MVENAALWVRVAHVLFMLAHLAVAVAIVGAGTLSATLARGPRRSWPLAAACLVTALLNASYAYFAWDFLSTVFPTNGFPDWHWWVLATLVPQCIAAGIGACVALINLALATRVLRDRVNGVGPGGQPH